MYQNNYNGYYGPQTGVPQRVQPAPQMLKGHPVSSLEEAKVATIDFDGSIFFFPDVANKKIYTKQINMDGTATLNMYEQKAIPMAETSAYVTREEFNQTLLEIKKMLEVQQTVSREEVKQAEEMLYNF